MLTSLRFQQPQQFLGLGLPDCGLRGANFPDCESVLLSLVVEVDTPTFAPKVKRSHGKPCLS